MPEKVMPGPVEGTGGIREAVCVHTRKIYDSCRDKDCMEDLRFYPQAPVRGRHQPRALRQGRRLRTCCTSMWMWSRSISIGASTRWICGFSTT